VYAKRGGGEAPKVERHYRKKKKHKKPKEVTITRNLRGGGKEGEIKEKTRNGSPIISASLSALSLSLFFPLSRSLDLHREGLPRLAPLFFSLASKNPDKRRTPISSVQTSITIDLTREDTEKQK
jgi:hypothetical protein